MRPIATVIAVCGMAAAGQAQELIRVTYSASTVIAGTTTPSGGFIGDLAPGEGVRFQVTLQALRNGTNAIGQTTTYTPPPPPGTGTIRGLGSFLYDFVTDAVDATGTWYSRSISAPFTAGVSTGTVASGGATLTNLGGSQFPAPGTTASGTNPVAAAFVGYWTPNSYSPRFINFRMQSGSAAPTDQDDYLLVQYGSVPETNDPLYTSKYVTTDFGQGINIGINIPAPASAPVLVICGLLLGRRRS